MEGARVNIFCLVGAVIGVVAVFSTWIAVRLTSPISSSVLEHNLVDIYDFAGIVSDYNLAVVLLLIGAIVAFISPLGGMLQLVGTLLFISAYPATANIILPSGFQWEENIGLGPYLALVGAVIVLASLVYPVGLGYRQKPVGVIGRFITISPASRLPQPSSQGIAESPPSAP